MVRCQVTFPILPAEGAMDAEVLSAWKRATDQARECAVRHNALAACVEAHQ